MSRQPPRPPPPASFPEAFAHTRSTHTGTRQNVTGDSAYLQEGPAPGHVHPSQMPIPTSYSSQQYSSSQSSPTPSRRSRLPTTPSYDHASLPPQPPAPPPLSGSTSYNPSFPVPAVPVRHSSTNSSGPPPPAPPPILHRTATMPMPVPPNTVSSVPYDMRPQNTMHSPPQPRIPGGPQSAAQGYSYQSVDVHERDDNSSNFRAENLEQSREGTRHSGEYRRDRAPPSYSAAGIQMLRCMICRRVSTRVAAEARRWYCIGGHMGQWQPA